jgi:ribose-phosphate pyrophosphokinase
MVPITLVSGDTMLPLAEHCLTELRLQSRPVSIVRLREIVFPNGEYIAKAENTVRGTSVILFFNAEYPSPLAGMMRLMITLNALHLASPRDIRIVAPFLPFMRQDRKSSPREPITVQLVAEMLQQFSSVCGLTTLELHTEQVTAAFRIPVDNLHAEKLFVDFVESQILKGIMSRKKLVIVAPDINSSKRAQSAALLLGVPYGIFDKRRDQLKGAMVESYIGPKLKGKTAVMLDDMVDTCGTILSAGQSLVSKGAQDIYVGAAHAILSTKETTAWQKIIDSGFKVFVTNSIRREPTEVASLGKGAVHLLSIDSLFAHALREACTPGGSVSKLK